MFVPAAILVALWMQDSVRLPVSLPVEAMFDQRENEEDESDLMEQIVWLQEHPYDLNTVRLDELAAIPGMTSADAAAVIAFRGQTRRFSAVEQLGAMDDGGEQVLAKLKPYITLRQRSGGRRSPFLEFRARIGRSSGSADTSFLGSPVKTYCAITLAPVDKVRAGVVLTKDAGERLSDGFTSGYLEVRDLGILTEGIAGDFLMDAGQGLVFWRGTSPGKGGDPATTPRKIGLGLHPYQSTNEFSFFRGVALGSSIGLGSGTIHASVLWSSRPLGATLNAEGSVETLYESGLFRTDTELKKRHAVREQVAGGRVEYTHLSGISVGISYCRATFDSPIVPGEPRQFAGNMGETGGIDARFNLRGLEFFSELARSRPGASALVAGCTLSFGMGSSVMFIFRDYPPEFSSFHARTFGEHADGKNERGMYVSVEWSLTDWLRIAGLFDRFKFPWRTYLTPFAAGGQEFQVQLDASLTPAFDLTYRYSGTVRDHAITLPDSDGRATKAMVERDQQRHRISATLQANPRMRFRAKLEMKYVRNGPGMNTDLGTLVYCDVRYEHSRKFMLETGLMHFDTDSYDSRMSGYEHDMPGVFSAASLYGEGRRWYVLAGWNIVASLQLSGKYSQTESAGEIRGQASLQLSVRY